MIGGGLAGCEAAWAIAQRHIDGVAIDIYEMRPEARTPAHESDNLAELVCSNSFKSYSPSTPIGLLKQNLGALGSIIIQNAYKARVPAGKALAVDREKFAKAVTVQIESEPAIKLIRQEVSQIPDGYEKVIVASGPLTSEALSSSIQQLIGEDDLFFYDAIAPIIEADSVDMDIAFIQDRYGEPGTGDYLNLPMNQEEYEAFVEALLEAEKMEPREFEQGRYFDPCLPVEEIARRGKQSLAFGPLKPVGLCDPRSLAKSHAVVQLRKETFSGDAYNMVGFQTKLKYPEQERVFRMIPGLKDALFVRHGSLHRNTYINSPIALKDDLTLKAKPHVRLAGQITGVEGYMESTAIGRLAGSFVADELEGKPFNPPPPTTTFGALLRYITHGPLEGKTHGKVKEGVAVFQPTNINFSLFPPLEVHEKKRKLRREKVVERAAKDFVAWRSIKGPGDAI